MAFKKPADDLTALTPNTIIFADGAGHYLQLPKLTTTQRDALSPVEGMVIYNSTTTQIERYQGGVWESFAGVSDHGELTGLADDDHTQYAKADGTREYAKIILTDGANHYLQLPKLTTTQRNALTPINGMIIYNSTTTQFERYQADAWTDFGGITDHGALTGLTDDDHTQYAKADGTRNYAKIILTDGAGHYLQLPQLTTSERDNLTPVNGMVIYNSTNNRVERYQASTWTDFGGVSDHGALSGLGDDDHTQYVLESKVAAGTATVTAGNTTIAVSHGLGVTPTAVVLTPQADIGGRSYWVSNKGTSQFTINISSSDPFENFTFEYIAYKTP